MSALMKQRVVYVLTHDSIGLGEDGPTHQPVEHATALRVIPNLEVWRPCDGVGNRGGVGRALERTDGPTACCCRARTCRSGAPTSDACRHRRGGYVLSEAAGARPRDYHRDRLGSGRSRSTRRSCSPRGASGCASSRCRRPRVFDAQAAA